MTASLEPTHECKSGIALSATAAVKFQQPPDSQKRQVLALREKKYPTTTLEKTTTTLDVTLRMG